MQSVDISSNLIIFPHQKREEIIYSILYNFSYYSILNCSKNGDNIISCRKGCIEYLSLIKVEHVIRLIEIDGSKLKQNKVNLTVLKY
jgi:hypothetical protein